MNASTRKLNPLTLVLFGIVGAGVGFLLQTYRSGVGQPPFSPPFSLPASLLVMSLILIVLARRLKRATDETRTTTVNPFHAVRLLAAAWAAQFTGALFAGFGVGLAATIIGRVSQLAVQVWAPVGLTALSGAVLVVAGVITERMCRIPPNDEAGQKTPSGESPRPENGAAQAYEPSGD